jgi:sugar (pentulose or hexulose) kinase
MSTVLGLDLGTSSFKVSAYEESGRHLGTLSHPTRWEAGAAGLEMDATWFAGTVRQLVDQCAREYAEGPVAGIGVAGMAETMFVDTVDGRRLPARAWNTGTRSAQLPDVDAFRSTGLLDPGRTPAVHLRAAREAGVPVASWAGLPERAVHALGGRLVAERSLAARTGLVDVVSGQWSPMMVAWSGLDLETLPRIQRAGADSGSCDLAGPCADATLTVAGHDHLVAALGAGADDDTTVFDSLGTGEALIARVVSTPEGVDQNTVTAFNAAGFNVGLGLGAQDLVALGGLGTGNRFNALLSALAERGFDRDDVMSASHSGPFLAEAGTRVRLPSETRELLDGLFGPDWQEVRDAGVASAVIQRTVPDLAAARTVWWAAVTMAAEVARNSLMSLFELLPHLGRLVATGGWLGNSGIRRTREAVLGPFEVPEVIQCGTRGAALLGVRAGGLSPAAFHLPPELTGVSE